MMPPWLLALVVLLAVCVIGWYLIYSRHDGVPPEGFVTQDPLTQYVENYLAPSIAKLAAETDSKGLKTEPGQGPDANKPVSTVLNQLLTEIRRVSKLYSTVPADQQQGLINNINFQNIPIINDRIIRDYKLTSSPPLLPYSAGMVIPTVESAPTTGTSASSAVAARGTPTPPVVDPDYQALAGQALTGQTATLTPELKTFLQQVQGKVSIDYPAPSSKQLDAAQGQDATGSVVVPGGLLNDPAVYKAFQQIIKPHETPTVQQPGLVANQRGVDGVQAGAILTPSMRQQIRDDVRKAVGEELANIQNEYEITYDQQ
jgi:hypothetical protein